MTSTFQMIPASNKVLYVIIPVCLIALGLLVLFGYILYSSRHVRFEVDRHALHIRGDLYGRDIDLSDLVLSEAKSIDLEHSPLYHPVLRTNGSGLPGYKSGWFKLQNGERALLFVTDLHRVTYLPTTQGYSLLLSIRDSPAFLAALRNGQVARIPHCN
jgi:hypothetical protein